MDDKFEEKKLPNNQLTRVTDYILKKNHVNFVNLAPIMSCFSSQFSTSSFAKASIAATSAFKNLVSDLFGVTRKLKSAL